MNVVYHEFCNWKTILCEKTKVLSNIYENSQENTLQESIFLMKLHTSLFLEYFQMFPFETTSIKACKLYIVCIICSSQQIRWLRGWKWSMGKSKCSHKEKRQFVHSWKETAFFLFDHSFKGMESGLIWAIQ